jgi:hypothetical protein
MFSVAQDRPADLPSNDVLVRNVGVLSAYKVGAVALMLLIQDRCVETSCAVEEENPMAQILERTPT